MKNLIEYHLRHGFKDPDELLDFIEVVWKLSIPKARVCPHHTAPADYITDAFFEKHPNNIVWANRGGGKTLLATLSSWLDMVFKPSCSTKMLGGSLEQSEKMYAHLIGEGDGWGLITKDFAPLLHRDSAPLILGANKSAISIHVASLKSVRGAHPQKLKLDEIDDMDPNVFEAALMIPITKGGHVASVHALSTLYKHYGLMNSALNETRARGWHIYSWCILETMERCEGRECETCDLLEDCQGRLRHAAGGFYKIEDAISKKRRVSDYTWKQEYLCIHPSALLIEGHDTIDVILDHLTPTEVLKIAKKEIEHQQQHIDARRYRIKVRRGIQSLFEGRIM